MNIEYTYSWPVSEIRYDENKGFVKVIFSGWEKDITLKYLHPRPIQKMYEKRQKFKRLLEEIYDRRENEKHTELAY